MVNNHQACKVAIAGVTGAVGKILLDCLEKSKVEISDLVPLASKRSAGKKIIFKDKEIEIRELREDSFIGIDYALFSAGASISRKFAPAAVAAGACVIDNSSAFRTDPDVPLVVPEINAGALRKHKGLIANPNCTTAIALTAIAPLHRVWRIRKIIASTYQSVSGAGAVGMSELAEQTTHWAKMWGGKSKQNFSPDFDFETKTEFFSRRILMNIIPMIGGMTSNNYTDEEMKLQNESRKILGEPDLLASATCARVPVMRSHAVAASCVFEHTPSVERARELLKQARGVEPVDEPLANDKMLAFPCSIDASGVYECKVGRIRKDNALKNALSLWVVGDQLLKGAALNATQILEELVALQVS